MPIDPRDSLITRVSNVLERMQKDMDYIRQDIASLKGERSERWKCVACGRILTSMAAVPSSVITKCPACGKKEFVLP